MKKYLIVSLAFTAGMLLNLLAVKVAWDPNPENDISHYKVYYYKLGSGLTNIIQVSHAVTNGPIVSPALTNISAGSWQTYVTAVNFQGLESDPSQILDFSIPNPPSNLNLIVNE